MGKGPAKQDKILAYAAKTGESVEAVQKGMNPAPFIGIVSTGNKKGKFIPHMAKKLDSEDIIKPTTVDASTAQSIMQARQKKGWTQIQLAKVLLSGGNK